MRLHLVRDDRISYVLAIEDVVVVVVDGGGGDAVVSVVLIVFVNQAGSHKCDC